MVGGSAAVGPGDVGAIENAQVLALEQDAGGEAGIVLVEGGLEGIGARRGKEAGQHGDRATVQREREAFETAALGSALQAFAEEIARRGGTRQCGSGLAFPARGFEREEGVAPCGKSFPVGALLDRECAKFRKAAGLTAQFLALLPRERGFQIGLGREVRGEQGTLLAQDHFGMAPLHRQDMRKRGMKRAVEGEAA